MPPEGLRAWLGEDFGAQAAMVSQVLAIGVLIYSLDFLPAEWINAAGRPDFTAKVRLLELASYLPLAWFLITRLGIAGAAIAWSLRILVDTFVLSAACGRIFRGTRRAGGGIFACNYYTQVCHVTGHIPALGLLATALRTRGAGSEARFFRVSAGILGLIATA